MKKSLLFVSLLAIAFTASAAQQTPSANPSTKSATTKLTTAGTPIPPGCWIDHYITIGGVKIAVMKCY
jgi:hypothetical protein